MSLLPQNMIVCSMYVSKYTTFYTQTMESDEMSFQVVHQMVFLCFLLVLVGSCQIATIPDNR